MSSLRRLLALSLLALVAGCTGSSGTMAATDGNAETTGEASGAGRGSGPAPTSGITDGDSTTSGGSPDSSDGSAGEGNLPEGENCCEAHRGPGCNEPEVVECVCAIDVACCGFDWSGGCVDLAQNACEASCQAAVTAGESAGTRWDRYPWDRRLLRGPNHAGVRRCRGPRLHLRARFVLLRQRMGQPLRRSGGRELHAGVHPLI